MSNLRSWLLMTLAVAALAMWHKSYVYGAEFRETGEELVLECPGWRMALSAESGTIRRLEDRSAQGVLLRGGENLWVIERHEMTELTSSALPFRYDWDAAADRLALVYDGPEAVVTITCRAMATGPRWQSEVTLRRGTMVGWQFPVKLTFDVAELDEFIMPDNLGLAFTRSFFQPGGGGVGRHSLGSAGLQRVAEDRCQMRPVQDPPVAARPGEDASKWLPSWYLREMDDWRVTANRCPAGEQHDLALVETEHGCWLSGYQSGGRGWLLRFGGMLRGNDTRPQMASVVATLDHLRRNPPLPDTHANARRIGVVLSRPAARPGVRLRPNPKRWMFELSQAAGGRAGALEFETLRDPATVRAALAEPQRWFAIVNTLPEGFLAESPDRADSMLMAIRDYVRRGGIWWEAGGGYSFYHAVVPQGDTRFRTANRHFCDFAAINSTAGRWSLFGIQQPEDIYVPPEAEVTASGPSDQRIGQYTHTFHAYGSQGQETALPRQQMVLGTEHRRALQLYGRQNGYTRQLDDKASPELVDQLKRSILLKVTTSNLAESARLAERLPFPVLFHIAYYLRGGFDKQYPDHLPPNARVGTGEDLARLIQACRRHGHLFMPYTNPTWWCVNPKGPTFERVGNAPLSRTLDGQLSPESYGSSSIQGYTVCAWHPAVRAANDVILDQFTRQYPVDVLFQDQVGARRHRWDTNPAAPHPGAYLEGIHRIARADAAHVPLGTEDGHDRLINCQTIFSGLSWPWLPNRPRNDHVLYEDKWPEKSWRIEPLALLLAHDKAFFYHHDLGGFVRNRLDLSMTLAMGYGLSWWTHTASPKPAELDWLERLCRVQAAIGPRCAGRALDEFDYLAPQVIRSGWGDLEIIANLTSRPWKVDDNLTIAPQGFLARAPDLEAGILTHRAGRDHEPSTLWLIRQRANGTWSEWSRPAVK